MILHLIWSHLLILLAKFYFTTTEDFGTFQKINKLKLSPCNSTFLFVMITMLFIGVTSMSYVCWKINTNNDSEPTLTLSTEELKNLVLSIVDEDFDRLFTKDDSNQTSFLGELRVLDNNYNVLWSKNLNDMDLRYLDKKIVSFDQKSKYEKEFLSHENDYSG